MINSASFAEKVERLIVKVEQLDADNTRLKAQLSDLEARHAAQAALMQSVGETLLALSEQLPDSPQQLG